MSIVKFISETKLKELVAINGNTDNALIQPIILECQRIYIEPIIGTGLYNELETQIEANTLTVLNTTLLDSYIIPCLVAWIKYESPVELNYKFTNKNVSTKNSENSTPIGLEEARFLMDRFKNKAEYHSERITKYLCENSVSYPLYDNPGNGTDTVYPNGSNYTTGMVLDFNPCGSCGLENCRCGKIYLG
jgi:hypothetical protein